MNNGYQLFPVINGIMPIFIKYESDMNNVICAILVDLDLGLIISIPIVTTNEITTLIPITAIERIIGMNVILNQLSYSSEHISAVV